MIGFSMRASTVRKAAISSAASRPKLSTGGDSQPCVVASTIA